MHSIQCIFRGQPHSASDACGCPMPDPDECRCLFTVPVCENTEAHMERLKKFNEEQANA